VKGRRAFGYHQGQRSDQAAPKAGYTIASDPSVGTLMSLQSRGRPYTAKSSPPQTAVRPVVADGLARAHRAKTLTLAGRRYIVCRNHQESEKDAADRASIVAALQRQLAKGDKALGFVARGACSAARDERLVGCLCTSAWRKRGVPVFCLSPLRRQHLPKFPEPGLISAPAFD
jgi:hypothetical protein